MCANMSEVPEAIKASSGLTVTESRDMPGAIWSRKEKERC
jgi:hypothetical protein